MLSSAPSRGHPCPSTFCPGGEIGRQRGVPTTQLSPGATFPKLVIRVTSLVFSISPLPLLTRYFSLSIHIAGNLNVFLKEKKSSLMKVFLALLAAWSSCILRAAR